MYLIRPLLLLCLLLLYFPLAAQQYNFRNWTLEQGLPQSQVNDIIQDHKGQLWIATRGGVSRFNGKQFHTYTKDDGLSSNNISALLQDKDKNIWIGSSDRGLVKYDSKTFRKFGKEQGLNANTIYDIIEDAKGCIWLATETGIFYNDNGYFKKYRKLPQQPYTSILISPDNAVWAGSQSGGLYKVSEAGIFHFTTDNSNLPSNQITTLYNSKNGNLWIGTEMGVSVYSNNNIQTLKLPLDNSELAVSDFIQDVYGNIWIALKQNGLIKYDGKGFSHITRQNGLRTKRINTLATGMEGNIWIGTNGYSLQQLTTPWFVHYFEFSEISEPRITALAKDNRDIIWAGTDEGNITYLDGERFRWHLKPPWPEGTTIRHIVFADNQAKWVATSSGLWHITATDTIHYTVKDGLPANDVYQCLPDTEGNVWIATANGIAYFSKDKIKAYTLSGPQQVIKAYCLFKDSKGNIWIGASNGVFKIVNDKLIKAPELEKLRLEEVTCIAEDKQGILYFGAFNYGIAILNKKWQAPLLITNEKGLPNESIKGLYIDTNDNLWVGTSRNILKIMLPELRKDKNVVYKSYNASNGFRGIEISHNAITQTADGNIWFGTTKGLTKYTPKLDRPNTVYPKVTLDAIMLYQKPTNWSDLGYAIDTITNLPIKLNLPHTQNHITFDFHAICLSGPEQVRYKYRLTGYDNQWSQPTDQSYATFPNLSPDTYTLEVLAQNNDGYWTPKPLAYTFAIVPPIWRREWFIGVLILVIAGAILSIVKLRERSLVKVNSLLEMRVNHRTRLLERKNREKEMLLQEIHHRVKNNLQIVISMLNLQTRYVQDPKAIEVMRAIKSRIRSMAILHERLYRHDDLGEIDLDDYFRGICESLYDAYGVNEEQVKLELSIPPIKVDIDTAITLGLIVNELVSNSLKYAFPNSEQNGLLSIVLNSQQNDHYILTVCDNGKGLPDDFNQKITHSFGLQLVASLSKKVNGKINFINKHGTKSILSFVLPS